MRKKIDIPLYSGVLILEQHENLKSVKKRYNTKSVKGYKAIAFRETSKKYNRYVIGVDESTDASIIAHEALHVTNMILQDSMVYLDPENDEPQAYLLGWIVDKCHKYFKV